MRQDFKRFSADTSNPVSRSFSFSARRPYLSNEYTTTLLEARSYTETGGYIWKKVRSTKDLQYLKELLDRGLLKKVMPHIRLYYPAEKATAAARELLGEVLEDPDPYAEEISSFVDNITRLYISEEGYSEFRLLIRSTSVQIWKEILTSVSAQQLSRTYYYQPKEKALTTM